MLQIDTENSATGSRTKYLFQITCKGMMSYFYLRCVKKTLDDASVDTKNSDLLAFKKEFTEFLRN